MSLRDQIHQLGRQALEAKGLSAAMLDRLMLNPARVAAMAQGVREVVDLPDPVGEELAAWTRPNGLQIRKVRVPIGVIGIIYESRPNVTSDAAVLCFKSGNATILRGGSEAFHSNTAIAAALQAGGEPVGLPPHSIQLVPFTDRESVQHLAEMNEYLDLIIQKAQCLQRRRNAAGPRKRGETLLPTNHPRPAGRRRQSVWRSFPDRTFP